MVGLVEERLLILTRVLFAGILLEKLRNKHFQLERKVCIHDWLANNDESNLTQLKQSSMS